MVGGARILEKKDYDIILNWGELTAMVLVKKRWSSLHKMHDRHNNLKLL